MSTSPVSVPLSDVRPDPAQPRTYFKESALKALALSIKKTGQRQPITVRSLGAGAKPPYEIIDGERRWRACQLAGIETIRIDVEAADLSRHASQHMMSLASNFMREGHTHMEISAAVQYQVAAAMEAGETRGQAVQSVMEAIGKSDMWVYSYLQLQNLCADLQELMHPDIPDNKRLRFSEAVLITGLSETKQKSVYRAVMKVSPARRLNLARNLISETTGKPVERRMGEITSKTSRFIARVSAELDRMLDYTQTDFQQALAKVAPVELKEFRDLLVMLLGNIEQASKRKARG